MATINDDGHSPATCTYNECRADSDVPCPFLRDEPKPSEGLKKLAAEIKRHDAQTKADLLDELVDVLKRILDA